MGAGSTAGNAGQLMTISGTINSTAESAAYSYDNLGRLVTSDQTTNGSSAQRKFGYDRWGNRTTVWPSVFGGSPIQTAALEQSGGAPTNRITSVTNSGVTVNYSYDAAGNVTNDGEHAYQYDAENRLVKVDSGATAQYKYDHQNRRVSKIIGSSWTHYVWQGGQVIGEHNATTAYTANPTYQVNSARLDYIYFGSQRIYSRERASSGGTWTTKYYLSDRLSTRVVLDGSGNVIGRQGHLPFGEDFGETGTQEKHHFTSYERDGESGTDYAVNRQYAQGVGRFLSVDPVSGSKRNPQSLNRYAYVGNDPVGKIDALGLCPPQLCPKGQIWSSDRCKCVQSSDRDPGSDDDEEPVDRSGDLPRLGGPWVFETIVTDPVPADLSAEPSPNTGKTYRCSRPLKQVGSKEPCSGELCHEYLCADKNGKMECWGLSPSINMLPGMPPWVLSPGVNNPEDQYHPENCTEVSSDFCMSKCVRKKFNPEKPPLYGYGPQGTDCHEWADDTIATCEKKCRGAT